jgi:hypothetical protein
VLIFVPDVVPPLLPVSVKEELMGRVVPVGRMSETIGAAEGVLIVVTVIPTGGP